jgi:hypothetical protein
VRRLSFHRGDVAGLIVTWAVAVGAGMLLLGAYATWPGDPGTPPSRWPAGTDVRRDDRRPTLLIFLHPRCPCSRASVAELVQILDRCGGRIAARAVLLRPRRGHDGGIPSDLAAGLAGVPGLLACPDPGGEEARRFGVATSGHVLVYDPRGRLIFSGGITPGRGERGDGVGRAALLGRILGASACGAENPVFGCPLATPRSTSSQDGPS